MFDNYNDDKEMYRELHLDHEKCDRKVSLTTSVHYPSHFSGELIEHFSNDSLSTGRGLNWIPLE
jgi:hypothetical protein